MIHGSEISKSSFSLAPPPAAPDRSGKKLGEALRHGIKFQVNEAPPQTDKGWVAQQVGLGQAPPRRRCTPITAQGSALGIGGPTTRQPEGLRETEFPFDTLFQNRSRVIPSILRIQAKSSHKTRWGRIIAKPFRLPHTSLDVPRALPWAVIFLSFQGDWPNLTQSSR